VAVRCADFFRYRERLRVRFGTREHRRLELLVSEVLGMAEDGPVEILVERQVSGFEGAKQQFMPFFEFSHRNSELLKDLASLLPVPAVRGEHSSDVPEHRANVSH